MQALGKSEDAVVLDATVFGLAVVSHVALVVVFLVVVSQLTLSIRFH